MISPLISAVRFLFLFMLSLNFGCSGQDAASPPKSVLELPRDAAPTSQNKHYLSGAYVDKEDLPKGFISETMTDQYPSTTFHFHNDEGKEVKTIREDQFPTNNPIFKLPFLKNTDKQVSWRYYLPLSNFDDKTGRELPQISVAEKVKTFNTLRKYGLHVKTPETVTDIVGAPSRSIVVITPPLSRYLVRCEKASVYYRYAKESHDANGNTMSNSLLDCSYISVYNHLGGVVQQILVPDKLIKAGWVSDDGKYLFCDYTLGYIWDEGPSEVAGGFLLIDLSTKVVTLIEIPEFQKYVGGLFGFFADDCFQMQGEGKNFLYLNPYTHTYHTIFFQWEQIKDKKHLLYQSFMPFEGSKIDLSQHQKHTY